MKSSVTLLRKFELQSAKLVCIWKIVLLLIKCNAGRWEIILALGKNNPIYMASDSDSGIREIMLQSLSLWTEHIFPCNIMYIGKHGVHFGFF